MKKTISLLSLSALLFTAACSNETKPAETTKQVPAAKTEVIVVKPAPTVIIKEAPAKPTTITLDKNGIKVGTKKVDVSIKRDQ